jgi:biotin operon repressor
MTMAWGSFHPTVVSTKKLALLRTEAGKDRLIALKVWLALLFTVDFSSRNSSNNMVSLEKLAQRTGMRKPTVLKAIGVLEKFGWLYVERSRRGNTYTVMDRPEVFVDGGLFVERVTPNTLGSGKRLFTKVPDVAKAFIRDIPSRGRIPDAALALYLVLLKYRENGTQNVFDGLPHTTLRDLTGIQPKDVRAGLDLLVNHRMIHVLEAEDLNEKVLRNGAFRQPRNRYRLKGAFDDRPQRRAP